MNITLPSMQDLLTAGVHFGHKVSRGHPKMSPFIFGARDGVHIINLEQSEQLLKEAAQKAYEFGKEGKVLLLLGTKKQAREIIEKLGKEAQTPYLNARWIGGFFTNFDEVRKNIKKLNELKEEREKGTLQRYTKKEQLIIARKLEKFNKEMGGVAQMEEIPDGIFMVDPVSDNTAVKEARKTGVVIFGLADTNSDPNWLDFAVPANDDGIKSINIVTEALIGAYIEGKKEGKVVSKKERVEEKVELDGQVAKEAEALEEEIEKEVLEESERKIE